MTELNDSAERIHHPFQKIENDLIIIDPKGRRMHQLNDVGSRVWELLINKQTVSAIINTITDEYEVNPSTAKDDIIKLLDQMSDLKLIKMTRNE